MLNDTTVHFDAQHARISFPRGVAYRPFLVT
jgi:hypothetical protein